MKCFYAVLLLIISSTSLCQTIENLPELQERLKLAEPFSEEYYKLTMDLFYVYRTYKKKKDNKQDVAFTTYNDAYLSKAIKWAEKEGSNKQLAAAKIYRAYYYHVMNDPVGYIAQAKELVNDDVFPSLEDKWYIYKILSHYYKSTGFLKELIEIAPVQFETGRQLNYKWAQLYEEYSHIGLAYYNLGDFEIARTYFNKGIQEVKGKGRSLLESSFTNNVALTFAKQKQIDSARVAYNQSLKILEDVSNPKTDNETQSERNHFKDVIKANIAYLSISKGNYDEAIRAIKQELKSGKEEIQFATIIQAGNKLGRLYYYKKEYDSALHYLSVSRNYFKKLHDNSFIVENKKWWSKVLLVIGEQEESDRIYDEMVQLQDSVNSSKAKQSTRIAGILYEVDKKDLEIKSQKGNIDLLDIKNKVKNQWLVFGGLGLFAVFSFILLYRSRNTAKNKQKAQQNFTQGFIKAQETERSRLALELHDGVGQQLMMLTRKSKNSGDESMVNLATNTLSSLRSISRNLHPYAIKQLGFTAAVENFVNGVDLNSETFFTLDIDNADAVVDDQTALHLYRIIQEALANMIKHANAKSAEVTLKRNKNCIKLLIKDSGQGFDVRSKIKNSNSLGMQSIYERCKILNANLRVDSIINKGTELEVTINI